MVYRLLVFGWNIWNHIIVCKLSVLDRNTWNSTFLCKIFALVICNIISLSSCADNMDYSKSLSLFFSLSHSLSLSIHLPSRLGLWNTPTEPMERGKPPSERYDMEQSDWEIAVMLKLWEYGVLLNCHRSQVHSGPRVVAPDRVLSMGQIELNSVLILNWITWNRSVLKFKLPTYAKVNYLK